MSERKKEISKELDHSDVKTFLKQNPDFFNENPDLFSLLIPPSRSTDDNVVDFQSLMIEKMRSSLEELKYHQGHLIDTSRNNLTTQVQVHEAVLNLLEIESTEALCHVISQDWPDNLHIDVIRICFEEGHDITPPAVKHVTIVPNGSVAEHLGKDDIIQLRGDVEVSEDIFGPAKSLVKAEALIRIPQTDHNPPGILAFGSRDADMFYPGQGTELLRFLAKSFHKCLVQWLKREN